MEDFIGGLLRGGVLLSAVTIFVGAVIYLVRHGGSPADYRAFHGEPDEYRTISGILRNVAALRGRGIIQLGLLFLIATPLARERDRLYTIVAAMVFVILLYSLIFS